MLHKVSELCEKIESLKKLSDMLYKLKYQSPKSKERDIQVDNLITDIQSMCRLVSNDKNQIQKIKQKNQNNLIFDLDGYYIENGISYKIYKDKHGKSKMKRGKKLMADEYIIKSLKERIKEIKVELEFKETQSLNDELYEINDTLKKLGENEKTHIINFN
jgi:hypothetical protein